MKSIYLILPLLSWMSLTGFAQKATLASGGNALGSGGSVSYSIGEPVYTSFASASGNVNQGVQQPEVNIRLSIKVLLSGPFDIASGLMRDSLRIKNLLPTTEPYSSPPFNKTPILEAAGESINPSILSVSNQNGIVDWVLIELRSDLNPSNVVATKRALLQRDGDVVSHLDGVSPVLFARLESGAYYVTVKHRNHLGVMTASPVILNGSAVSVDFTTIASVYTLSTPITPINAARRSEGGVFTLWPGDANNNKNIKYNGLSTDKDYILTNALGGNINASLDGIYRVEDVNMDGKVRYNNTDNDRLIIFNVLGVGTPNNIYNQHTPN